jgi:hypothetical protein
MEKDEGKKRKIIGLHNLNARTTQEIVIVTGFFFQTLGKDNNREDDRSSV